MPPYQSLFCEVGRKQCAIIRRFFVEVIPLHLSDVHFVDDVDQVLVSGCVRGFNKDDEVGTPRETFIQNFSDAARSIARCFETIAGHRVMDEVGFSEVKGEYAFAFYGRRICLAVLLGHLHRQRVLPIQRHGQNEEGEEQEGEIDHGSHVDVQFTVTSATGGGELCHNRKF